MKINVIPRKTEKAYTQTKSNMYVFDVPLSSNKNDIKEAIESQFNVTVINIRTLVQDGKNVRFSRGKHRNPGTTKRKDHKKAYVTLSASDNIQVFDEPTEEEKK